MADAATPWFETARETGREIRVVSVYFDGRLRSDVMCELLPPQGHSIRVRCHAGTEIRSADRAWLAETTVTQVLFPDRWYNVLHFHTVEAPLTNLWYANVAMPVERDGSGLRWVDLDLDVVHDVECGTVLKDAEQFAVRARDGVYDAETVRRVYAARDEILELAATHAFPFDRKTQIR